jgi:hypothetical protein
MAGFFGFRPATPTWSDHSYGEAPKFDAKIAEERRKQRAEITRLQQSVVTLCETQKDFHYVLPRRASGGYGMPTSEVAQEIMSKARYLYRDGMPHQVWQSQIAELVNGLTEDAVKDFTAHMHSFAWADQVEGTPPELREKAPIARGDQDAALVEQRRLEAEKFKERLRQEEIAAELQFQAKQREAERREAEAKLTADIEELAAMEERERVGGGSWG